MREGLVGGEGFAVDASLIKADANRQKGIEGEKGLPLEATGRAAQEYLAGLDDAAFGAATEVSREVNPRLPSPNPKAASQCPELDEKRKCFAERVKEAATAATTPAAWRYWQRCVALRLSSAD